MKKIFILGLLLAPIVAHADDPVGPSAASGTPVVATANAPYATATVEHGDTTNVVSASYVKGAYNDAISAINKVAERIEGLSDYVNGDIEDEIAEKQDKLTVREEDTEISNEVIGGQEFGYIMGALAANVGLGGIDDYEISENLVNARGVADGIIGAIYHTGVKAVTTWGSNTETTLSFSPK